MHEDYFLNECMAIRATTGVNMYLKQIKYVSYIQINMYLKYVSYLNDKYV